MLKTVARLSLAAVCMMVAAPSEAQTLSSNNFGIPAMQQLNPGIGSGIGISANTLGIGFTTTATNGFTTPSANSTALSPTAAFVASFTQPVNAAAASSGNGVSQSPTAATGGIGTALTNNPFTTSQTLNTFAPQPASTTQSTILTAFVPALGGAGDIAVFRLANIGSLDGTATLQVFDTVSGTSLGSFTTGIVPAHGGIQFTSDALLQQLQLGQVESAFNVSVTATFRGTLQVLDRGNTGLVNVSACGTQLINDGINLGLVEGPGESDLNGIVRIVNGGPTVGAVRLTLRDPATGTTLASWTSPTVPAFAQLSVPTSLVASQAIPGIASSTALMTVSIDAMQGAMRIEHTARATNTAALVDLNSACAIGSGSF